MTKVAIWGSYHYGNFGDDLMAEIYARMLSEAGHEPVIISQNPKIVDTTQVAFDLDSAGLGNDDPVVIGGGAMLSTESRVAYLGRSASRAVEKEFRELLKFAGRSSRRVLPISVGGGGDAVASGIYGSRRRFFAGSWASEGTVRLRGDLEAARRTFGKSYEYFPDVLFTTPTYFSGPVADAGAKSRRLGINLHTKRAEPLLKELSRHTALEEYELVPVVTHSSVFNDQYEWGASAPDRLQYEELTDFLHGLSSLDALVSDKLHVGLVASTFGVPFVPYQPKAKTRSLHTELGLTALVQDSPEAAAEVVAKVLSDSGAESLADRWRSLDLSSEADGHRRFLLTRV